MDPAEDEDSECEHILFICREVREQFYNAKHFLVTFVLFLSFQVKVYQIPPRVGNRGYRFDHVPFDV